MKKMLLAALFVAAAAVWVASPVDASGLFRRNHAASSSAGCDSCAPAACAAPMLVSYVDKQVEGFKMETKTKVVPTQITRMVARTVEEDVKYTVCQTIMVPEKRNVTTYQQVMKDVPYTYTECVQVVTPTKQKVTTYQQVTKEVPYTYTVSVPVVTPTKRTVTTYQCVPETVTTMVNVARRVPTCVVDPCTGCVRQICAVVCEAVPQTCTVMKRVPVTQEVVVNVCTYTTEERKGVRHVCELVPNVTEVTVNVCSYNMVPKQGVRKVCELVPTVNEVTVNVCKTQLVEKVGKVRKTICEPVTEMVNVTQTYCEKVPYTYTVKVAVYTPAPAPAPVAPCDPCATSSPCGTAPCATSACGGARRARHTLCCR